MLTRINKANRKLEDINIRFDPAMNEDQLNDSYSKTGITPIFYLNSIEIKQNDISSFILSNTKFLPYLEISFTDTSNLLSNELFPKKTDIIKCFIRSTSKLKKNISIDFEVYEITHLSKLKSKSFKIKAIMHIEELYSMSILSYEGTSFDFMDTLTKKCHIGFMSNISNTNDSMKWLNVYDNNLDFLKTTIKHSYINDNCFTWGYIDFYYNLVFVDVQKQYTDNIENQTEALNLENFSKKPLITNLILTNKDSYSGSDLYISSFMLLNKSNKNEKISGDSHILCYFNKSDFNYTIKNISIIDKADTKKRKNIKKEHITYLGKIDNDNVHENHKIAYIHNELNLNEIQQVKISIILKNPNFNLYRFQKVQVELFNNNNLYEGFNKKKDPTIEDEENVKKNYAFSGEWLVSGIIYKYSPNHGFYQEVILIKNKLEE